ncbi:glycosyltransferase [Synechococcus sp. CS-1324]|nr:glycosyltransferase [Synechococcus sp. CS-1324]PZV04898.1 MAG: glycosyl transferase [Cyanobium sp.]
MYPFNASLLPALIGLKLAGVRRILVHLGNPVATTSPAKQKTHLLCALFSALGVTFVPCSQYVKSSLNRNCLLRRQAPIIPNGCDTRAILSRALKARKQDWTAGPTERDGARRHVVMVARLDHIKDHNTLLKAFAIARRQRTEAWGLWLVGDGDNDASLRKLSAELGMNPQDIFLGRRHDIPEILGAADLFAFSTTVAEGFGIALVEAMAAGLPILASDVPACREVLDQGASGRLVPAGDVQAWVSHLEALMEDAQLRIALAKRSSAAASQFDLSTTAQHWLRLVEA